MTVFVAVLASAPGAGKSTLCADLAAALAARGLSVDHFREEEILSRPAYAAVAAEFRDGGVVTPGTLLEATAAFVAGSTADVVIADALFPYLPSLRAWGHDADAVAGFLTELHEVIRPVVLYLDEDPLAALPRAAAREDDPGWLDWLFGTLGVRDLAGAAAYLGAERELALRLLAGWDLHVLPPATPAGRLRDAAGIVGGSA